MAALKEFAVTVTYFKPNGKYYAQETVVKEFTPIQAQGTCPMQDVVGWLEALRDEGKLPGLSSGDWDGFILATCDEGYPCLILPDVG